MAFALVANAHPGEQRTVCETVAQVNHITPFGLAFLGDPSKRADHQGGQVFP